VIIEAWLYINGKNAKIASPGEEERQGRKKDCHLKSKLSLNIEYQMNGKLHSFNR